MFFDRELESIDLLPWMYTLVFGGIGLGVYVMQTAWSIGENIAIRNVRRLSMIVMMLSMTWMLLYVEKTNWQPWPPAIGLLFAIDLGLASRALVLWRRVHEDDRPGDSTRQFSQFVRNLLMFALLGMLVTVTAMSLDRQSPYDRQVGEIIPPHAKSGEYVAIRWTGVVLRACAGTVRRYIIDSSGTTFFLGSVAAIYADVATPVNLIRYFRLPQNLAPGPAHYRAVSSFVCNPMHNLFPIVVEGPLVAFEVIE